MKKLKDILGKQVIIGDGSMGALLETRINGPFIPDEVNLSDPDLIRDIQDEYARAGADFITTNTFGASEIKLQEIGLAGKFKKINQTSVGIARKVADKHGVWVAGNLGPSGKLIDPLGDLGFQDAVDNFSAQAGILEKSGVDFILIETITEIQEFRAAVIGALSVVKIPVLASMSFPNEELSLSGTDGRVFAVTSDFVSLAVTGANCGNSLDNMKKVVEKIARYSPLPLLCQPNAGLPVLENGRTVFKLKPDAFADFMEDIYRLGVSILGSCCGSNPDFTRLLAQRFKGKPLVKRRIKNGLHLSTRVTATPASITRVFLVGERINPTGRKKLRRELLKGKLTTIKYDAREQEKSGSDALDINLNIHDLNLSVVGNIIKGVQNMVSIPLFIDSTDPEYVEIFCRLYAGKGVINSISGESESLERMLPLARTYNMAFIAALIDEEGISDSAEKRLAVARRIVKRAGNFGIPLKNIIFDPLVLSAGADISKVEVTLKTLELLKREFPDNPTIIGLSNISFGLPNREMVNATYLSMAVSRGLNMVIANPMTESVQDHLLTLNFLKSGSIQDLNMFIEKFSGVEKRSPDRVHRGSDSLYENILDGDSDSARENITSLIERKEPLRIISEFVIPAMDEVGRRYHSKEFFLPQLMASADAVKAILPEIKKNLPKRNEAQQIRVLLATVKGDIHDIGKNIISSILESFNFTVIDLGKDVSQERIISQAEQNRVDVIGLSTLMTTTVPEMLSTVGVIRSRDSLSNVSVFIGGAVVNQKLADRAGALYARDGIEMVRRLKKIN